MSEGIRTVVRYVEEATLGITPATPSMKPLRITRSALYFRPITAESEELVADRNRRDLPRVGQEAGGQLDLEMIYGNADDLLEGCLYSRWILAPIRFNDTADQNITDIAAGTGVITVLATAGTRICSGAFVVGHLVRASGETVNSGNNFLKRVTAATATSLTVATAGLVNNTAPNANYRLKVVGIEAPAATNIAVTVSGLGAGEVAAITCTGVDPSAAGIIPGMWIKGNGFAITPADNGWYRVLNVTSSRIGCDVAPAGVGADAATGVQARIYFGDCLRNGTTKISYALEQEYSDLTVPEYDMLNGQRVGQFSLELNQRAIQKASVTFLGMSGANSTSRFAGATTDAVDDLGVLPRAGDILNTSSHVARVAENGAAVAGPNYVLGLALNINNGLVAEGAVGQLTPVNVFADDCVVSGTITSFYGSNAIRTKILNGTASSIDWILLDAAGTKAVLFDLPRVKYSDGNPEGIQKGSRRTLPAAFEALYHTTYGYTIQIQRVEEFA